LATGRQVGGSSANLDTTDSVDCNTFGILSVSAEGSHDTFAGFGFGGCDTEFLWAPKACISDVSRFRIVRELDLCSYGVEVACSCRRLNVTQAAYSRRRWYSDKSRLCVCLSVHAVKEKQLELSTLKSIDI